MSRPASSKLCATLTRCSLSAAGNDARSMVMQTPVLLRAFDGKASKQRELDEANILRDRNVAKKKSTLSNWAPPSSSMSL